MRYVDLYGKQADQWRHNKREMVDCYSPNQKSLIAQMHHLPLVITPICPELAGPGQFNLIKRPAKTLMPAKDKVSLKV